MKKQSRKTDLVKFKKFKRIEAQILDSIKSERLFREYWKYLVCEENEGLDEWIRYRKFKGYPLDDIIDTLKVLGVFKREG